MKWKFSVRTISLFLLLILIPACSEKNETPTQVPAVTSVSTSTAAALATEPPTVTEPAVSTGSPVTSIGGGMPVAGSGLCANAYYPVREGVTWTYSSTGGPMGGYGFTDTITSIAEDGFTLASQFQDLTRTQEWACRPEGLVALQLGGTSAATLNNDDMQLSLDVSNVSGVVFPAVIAPGDTWQHAIEFTGTISTLGQQIEATGDAQSHFEAIGYESVTVPAGTFDALKVHIKMTININGIFGGVSFPVNVSSPYDYWFVQGVGWVKASGAGNVGGELFTETIELQSYNIP